MSRLRNYAQLIRLPNLPTALADICLGALALSVQPPGGDLEDRFPYVTFVLLLSASACLYMSGMVWNDYFDEEQDKRERSFRPIPSGRVSPREAAYLGFGLMIAGVVCAFIASWPAFMVSIALVAAIFLYDRVLKRFWAGPLGMGLCRFLNVLLGLSLLGTLDFGWGWHAAFIVGLYIVGVTWFARTEARTSSVPALQGAAAVMAASLLLALPLPVLSEVPASSVLFPYLLVALGFLIGLPIYHAIMQPTPPRVQSAVKRCLMGLVVLDAVLATALAKEAGLVILFLLMPLLALSWQRWLYAT